MNALSKVVFLGLISTVGAQPFVIAAKHYEVICHETGNRHVFNNDEIGAVLKTFVHEHPHTVPTTVVKHIVSSQDSIIENPQDYHVTGIAFGLDFNFAFLFDQQNPLITAYYKNQYGDIKYRSYYSAINSFGIKLEAALKFNIVFFTDTDFNFYESNKTIHISGGLDVSFAIGSGLDITYAEFANAPGGIIIIGIPFGLATPGVSIVTGGSLCPIR